jgi:hypothetical protein
MVAVMNQSRRRRDESPPFWWASLADRLPPSSSEGQDNDAVAHRTPAAPVLTVSMR